MELLVGLLIIAIAAFLIWGGVTGQYSEILKVLEPSGWPTSNANASSSSSSSSSSTKAAASGSSSSSKAAK